MGIRVQVNKSQIPAFMQKLSQAADNWAGIIAEDVKREPEAGLPGHWLLARSIIITSYDVENRRFVYHVHANQPYASAHEYGTYRRNKSKRGNRFDGKARNDRTSKGYGLKIHNKRRRYMGNAHKNVGKRHTAIAAARIKRLTT